MYGTCRNLREENVTTHQQRLENDLKKGMQRIRNVFVSYLRNIQYIKNVLQGIPRSRYNVSETFLKLFEQICCNAPETFCKLRDENVTTYQECLGIYLQKLLQRIT